MLKHNIVETQIDNENWQDLVANVLADSQNCQLVAEQFAIQLQKDHYAYKNLDSVTDCAIYAPHLYTVVDKTTHTHMRLRHCYIQLMIIQYPRLSKLIIKQFDISYIGD